MDIEHKPCRRCEHLIAEARSEEREVCAAQCESRAEMWRKEAERSFTAKAFSTSAKACADSIRARENLPKAWAGERDSVDAWHLDQVLKFVDDHLDPSGHFHLTRQQKQNTRYFLRRLRETRVRLSNQHVTTDEVEAHRALMHKTVDGWGTKQRLLLDAARRVVEEHASQTTVCATSWNDSMKCNRCQLASAIRASDEENTPKAKRKGDPHTRLTYLVDKHFGTRPTMPIEELIDILETEIPKLSESIRTSEREEILGVIEQDIEYWNEQGRLTPDERTLIVATLRALAKDLRLHFQDENA